MKSLHCILLCLLTIAVYFLSQNIGSSASSYDPARRILKVPVSSPNCLKVQLHEMQAIDDETKQSTDQDGCSKAHNYETTSDNLADIVYHIDYHGVTTHPTPTPKHPKP